jgi:hypothetical protein
VRSHPTAGQATLEYIAAVALLAALLLVAAPAVGAPDIGRSVADALRHGICLAGGDICTKGDARRAGLPPCPLTTKTTGWDGTVEVMMVDVGGKFTLAVTRKSDGSVSVVRVANAGKGASAGIGAELDAGPIHFDIGAEGAVTKRFQVAAAWDFPDETTAAKFLEHPLRNAVRLKRWPPSWWSTENAAEVAASIGIEVGGSAHDDRYEVVGASGFLQVADGAVSRRDGGATFYARTTLDGPEFTAPLTPSKGRGRTEWIVELTVDAQRRPIELAFRNATPSNTGNTLTEVVKRLDLRDPANYAAARPLLEHRPSWPRRSGPSDGALEQRIATHGTTETLAYAVEDDTIGASGALKAAVALGLGAKRVKITRRLVEATVQRGALTGQRLDCVPARGSGS